MIQDHADLLQMVFEHLTAVHEEVPAATDRDFIQLLGRGIHSAMNQSAVYSIPQDVMHVAEYRTPEMWADFRAQLQSNEQAIFNHGDPGPENAIVALITTTQVDTVPANVADMFFLFMRVGSTIYGISGTFQRREGLFCFWPMISIDMADQSSRLHTWCLAEAEHGQEDGNTIGSLYLSLLCYLNDQIAADRTTGKYGDGVTFMGVTLIEATGGAPAWLI